MIWALSEMSMEHDLHKIAESVVDEKSFLAFIQAMAEDFEDECEKEEKNPSSPYSHGANGWENGSIDTMLGAAAAWGRSTGMNEANNTSQINPWRRCADILLAGKFYE